MERFHSIFNPSQSASPRSHPRSHRLLTRFSDRFPGHFSNHLSNHLSNHFPTHPISMPPPHPPPPPPPRLQPRRTRGPFPPLRHKPNSLQKGASGPSPQSRQPPPFCPCPNSLFTIPNCLNPIQLHSRSHAPPRPLALLRIKFHTNLRRRRYTSMCTQVVKKTPHHRQHPRLDVPMPIPESSKVEMRRTVNHR